MKKPENTYVTQPFMPPLQEFVAYLETIWDKKWLTNNGDFHQELEKSLAAYLGINHISLFSNGTLALISALQALRITGEVITTPFSFVATTHALHWNGIKPVFCDIEPETFNIDADKIEAAITPKTTAILAVHVYGNPCNVEKIEKIGDTYGLKVIYDACHTFGVNINGNSILNYGDLSVLSFHATKVFTTIEGGAIIAPDDKTKKRLDFLKNFGFADEVTVVAPGINAKLNEMQAAYGLLQLKYIDTLIEKRRQVAYKYRELLSGFEGVRYLNDLPGVKHNYPYFPVVIDKAVTGFSRDDLYDEFKKHNIYARKYFYPLISQFPAYRGLHSAAPANLPVATKIAQEVLCLPIFPELEMTKVEEIVKVMKSL